MAVHKELSDIFARFYSFEELLNHIFTYEFENNCVFARRHSQSCASANKTRKYKIPDEIMYVRIHFWCCHAKNDKTLQRAANNSKGMRKKGYQSTDCKANFIAIYDPLSKGLRIKTQEANWDHTGHPTTKESYAKSLKIRKLIEKDLTPNEKRRRRYLEKKADNKLQKRKTKHAKEEDQTVFDISVPDIDMQETDMDHKASQDEDLVAVSQLIEGPGSLRTPVMLNLDKQFIITARVADTIDIKSEPIEIVESASALDGPYEDALDDLSPCYEVSVSHHDYSLPGTAMETMEAKNLLVNERVIDSLYSVKKSSLLKACEPKLDVKQETSASGSNSVNKFQHFANFVGSVLEGLEPKQAKMKMRKIFDILEDD